MAGKTGTRAEIKPEQWTIFATAFREHGNLTAAASLAGMSRSTAHRAVQTPEKFPLYRRAAEIAKGLIPDGVKDYKELSYEAQNAVADFAYFRLRYFGRVATPWATHTANLVADLLATPNKEFVCCNEPPGVGKSTFWTIDLPAWLICRNRGVRIQLGSAAQSTAQDYVQQLRREFEREVPLEADEEQKRKGLAVDAQATLIDDFGGFKPPRGEAWTTEQFVVKQVGDRAKGNKEATVKALGRDTKFLGKRCDLIVWDDLVDERGVKNPESRVDLKNWWFKYAETRLEPGGLCVLQGQRLHADDLYREVIGVEVTEYDENEDSDGWGTPIGRRKQYVHVLYKAHYDEWCQGLHNPRTAPPYDPVNPATGGCLLDPKRLTFRDIMAIKEKDQHLYAQSYQQEDVDPKAVLVNPLWVSGGRDPETHEEFPGCWDRDRSMGEIPRLPAPVLSVVTADPSPSKFWSVQWWLYHPASEMRYLIDHYRGNLTASGLIDNVVGTNVYEGLLEEWHERSRELHAPFTHVIVERNAAQKWIYGSNAAKEWGRTRRVTFIGHDTHHFNKADQKLGVEALLPRVWKYGSVSLPSGDQLSRGRSQALVAEVTSYPESTTTDCVMAQWFLEHNLPRLARDTTRPAQPLVMPHRVMTSTDFANLAAMR